MVPTCLQIIPIGDVAYSSASSDTISHLGDIAIRSRRPLRWDPANERIIDDEQATRMLNRPLRVPWRL
jgi:hypothetical protein